MSIEKAQRFVLWVDRWVGYWEEAKRRWPLVLGIARGHQVMFNMQIGPPDQGMIVLRPGPAWLDRVTVIGAPTAAIRGVGGGETTGGNSDD